MRYLGLFLFAISLHAQVTMPETYSWRAGDDPAAATVDFDDSDWVRVPITQAPPRDGVGMGWLRYRIEVGAQDRGKPLGLYFGLPGKATGLVEIYLEGELIHRQGQPAATARNELPARNQNPGQIIFADPGPDNIYLVAVRYSDFFRSGPAWKALQPDFRLLIGDLSGFWDWRLQIVHTATAHQMVLTGLCMIFGLLHLLLFYYHPDMRTNLYFGLMVTAMAVMAFARYEFYFLTDPSWEVWQERALWVSFPFSGMMMMGFIYCLFQYPRSYFYKSMAVLCAGLMIWNMITPQQSMTAMLGFILLALLEVARVIGSSWVHRRDELPKGIWIIAVGACPLLVSGGHRVLTSLDVVDFELVQPDIPGVMYASIVLILSMSIYLAREFGRVAVSLEQQLTQVKVLSEKNLAQQVARAELESEHRSKTRELEEARDLQLSMLPKQLPEVDGFDIAVYMKPATEVGGDYYDFHRCENGVLVAAIGDATGHGLKAGTMVAATKSLFKSLVETPHPPDLLNRISAALKQMGFKGMFMALTVLRLQGSRLQMSAGGMPFAYLYKAAAGEIEEQRLKGLPLGGPIVFPYPTADIEFEAGDTLLLLSDGLPERFNPNDQMFGDDRTSELFAQSANASAEKIIKALVAGGDDWAEGRPQDDDVTFMVIKKMQA